MDKLDQILVFEKIIETNKNQVKDWTNEEATQFLSSYGFTMNKKLEGKNILNDLASQTFNQFIELTSEKCLMHFQKFLILIHIVKEYFNYYLDIKKAAESLRNQQQVLKFLKMQSLSLASNSERVSLPLFQKNVQSLPDILQIQNSSSDVDMEARFAYFNYFQDEMMDIEKQVDLMKKLNFSTLKKENEVRQKQTQIRISEKFRTEIFSTLTIIQPNRNQIFWNYKTIISILHLLHFDSLIPYAESHRIDGFILQFVFPLYTLEQLQFQLGCTFEESYKFYQLQSVFAAAKFFQSHQFSKLSQQNSALQNQEQEIKSFSSFSQILLEKSQSNLLESASEPTPEKPTNPMDLADRKQNYNFTSREFVESLYVDQIDMPEQPVEQQMQVKMESSQYNNGKSSFADSYKHKGSCLTDSSSHSGTLELQENEIQNNQKQPNIVPSITNSDTFQKEKIEQTIKFENKSSQDIQLFSARQQFAESITYEQLTSLPPTSQNKYNSIKKEVQEEEDQLAESLLLANSCNDYQTIQKPQAVQEEDQLAESMLFTNSRNDYSNKIISMHQAVQEEQDQLAESTLLNNCHKEDEEDQLAESMLFTNSRNDYSNKIISIHQAVQEEQDQLAESTLLNNFHQEDEEDQLAESTLLTNSRNNYSNKVISRLQVTQVEEEDQLAESTLLTNSRNDYSNKVIPKQQTVQLEEESDQLAESTLLNNFGNTKQYLVNPKLKCSQNVSPIKKQGLSQFSEFACSVILNNPHIESTNSPAEDEMATSMVLNNSNSQNQNASSDVSYQINNQSNQSDNDELAVSIVLKQPVKSSEKQEMNSQDSTNQENTENELACSSFAFENFDKKNNATFPSVEKKTSNSQKQINQQEGQKENILKQRRITLNNQILINERISYGIPDQQQNRNTYRASFSAPINVQSSEYLNHLGKLKSICPKISFNPFNFISLKAQHYLKIIVLSEGEKFPHQVPPTKYTIGRKNDCDIVLKNQLTASLNHAEIFFLDFNFYLRDAGSKNGTFIKQSQIELLKDTQIFLQPGFEITITNINDSGEINLDVKKMKDIPKQYQFTLTKESKIKIGRDKSNHIQIEDPIVSSLHAQIQFSEGKFIMEDCNSVNGIWKRMSAKSQESEPVLITPDFKFKIGTIIIQIVEIADINNNNNNNNC